MSWACWILGFPKEEGGDRERDAQNRRRRLTLGSGGQWQTKWGGVEGEGDDGSTEAIREHMGRFVND